MIKCFEANYPESLGVVLVHKSPWIFHSKAIYLKLRFSRDMLTLLGIWRIIKGWLDPVVANKVHFTKNLEELQEFVEKSHIPKELGGDDPWSYHYVEPIPGENDLIFDETRRAQLLDERATLVGDYEKTTQKWIRDHTFRAVLQQERIELTQRLRNNYWTLDPYLRARSLYDRTGLIQEGGKIQFYGPSSGVPAANPTGAAARNSPLPVGQSPDDVD